MQIMRLYVVCYVKHRPLQLQFLAGENGYYTIFVNNPVKQWAGYVQRLKCHDTFVFYWPIITPNICGN